MNLLPVLLLIWKPLESSWNIVWTEKWGILALTLPLYFLYKLYTEKKIQGALALALSYFIILSSLAAFFKFGSVSNHEINLLLRDKSLEQVVLFSCFLFFLRENINFSKLLQICGWTIFVTTVFSSHPRWETPILHNPSMTSVFIVLATRMHPLSIIAVYLCHSWTGLMVFLAGMIWRYRKYLLIPAFTIGTISSFFVPFSRIPDNGRFKMWDMLYSWWSNHGIVTHLFGAGGGSSSVWMPILGIDSSKDGAATIYIWAHNDYLQLLVDYGIVGLLIFLTISVYTFYKAKDQDRPIIIGFLVSMLTNFPLHWPITAIIGWEILKRTLLTDQVVYEDRNLTSRQTS